MRVYKVLTGNKVKTRVCAVQAAYLTTRYELPTEVKIVISSLSGLVAKSCWYQSCFEVFETS